MYSVMVSNPSRIKLHRRSPPNSNWIQSKPWNAVLQTDRCAEGKQLNRKPPLDLLITKTKPQFSLRGEFWHSSPEAKVSYTQNWGSNTTIEAKANIGLVALRTLQQHPASTAQKIIPWWRTFFVFLLKSPITTNSNDSQFLYSSFIIGDTLDHKWWYTETAFLVTGGTLVDVVLWGRCGPTAVRKPNQRHFFLKGKLWPGIR